MSKVNIPSFIYLVKNYPDLKQVDLFRILGVSQSLISMYMKSYEKGKYDDVLPEPGNLDERVAEHIRNYYPEKLAGPVKTVELPKEETKAEYVEIYSPPKEESKEPITVNVQCPKKDYSPGKFERLGQQIGVLVDTKNEAYGDSFAKTGDFLRLLYPNGIKPEQYIDALSVVRVYDKLMRIATKKDTFGENPWQDIAGYSLLAVMNGGSNL